MIDAGGEDALDLDQDNDLIAYLNRFFTSGPYLDNKIDTTSMTHPQPRSREKLLDVCDEIQGEEPHRWR